MDIYNEIYNEKKSINRKLVDEIIKKIYEEKIDLNDIEYVIGLLRLEVEKLKLLYDF